MISNLTNIQRAVRTAACLSLLLVSAAGSSAQGTFQNLDFEQANVPDVPAGQFGTDVSSTDGVPGWTTYIGGDQVTTILHNNDTLGAPAIAILGPFWLAPEEILQGKYTVFLRPKFDGTIFPAIAQLGLVPSTAQSVRFWGAGAVSVSFAGQQLPVSSLENTPNYVVYGADISAFAGQTGWLQFQGAGVLDNISFSDVAVPEPGVFGLSAVGGLLIGIGVLARRGMTSAAKPNHAADGSQPFRSVAIPLSVAAGSHR